MSNPVCDQLLRDAVEAVLVPLARLAVGRGLPYPQAEELLKRAYVRAARDARRAAGGAPGRDVSQVSVATGLGRREVQRISDDLKPPAVQRPAPATQLFHRWLADPALRGPDGRPRTLPRQGPAPSFEALAQSVTRHVHPRSLLAELERLGLAETVDDGQSVRLLRDHFVPSGDDARLLGFFAGNAGDHVAAAADNVVHGDRRHHEQALFTDDLSAESAAQVRALAQAQWQALVASLLPALERLIDEDRAAGRPPTHRARIGLFSYHEALPEETRDGPPAAP